MTTSLLKVFSPSLERLYRYCSFLFTVLSVSLIAWAEDWPCWRGPRLDGTSTETNVPVYWSATSNVIWKFELPGVGHASPVVAGERIFLVAAQPETQERVLLCLERAQNEIGEKCFASPAISHGQIFLRSETHLFCIGRN